MGNAPHVAILVVDDEEIIRKAVAFDFARRGFKVFSAENGIRAFELLQTEKIDLVISDLQMPECDGPTLLRKMRETRCATPLIFISGGLTLSEAECIKMGAQKFLSKPFDYKELYGAALTVLGLDSETKKG